MSPKYGDRIQLAPYSVADWLLGGRRKRLVLRALRTPGGVRADDLVEQLGVGRATAFETLRALREVNAIAEKEHGVWMLDAGHPLGEAIDSMLKALEELDDHPVASPRRGP